MFLYRFSLKILSRNSLHFVGISVFIVGYVRNVKIHFFNKTGHFGDLLASKMSHELTARPECQFLSCSVPIVMALQLPAYFTHVAFWRVSSRESLARSSHENPLNAHTLEFFSLFSHTTLSLFPLKYRVSNC